jgi:hypothetical protein
VSGKGFSSCDSRSGQELGQQGVSTCRTNLPTVCPHFSHSMKWDRVSQGCWIAREN